MIFIKRTHDEPISIDADCLDNLILDNNNFHRCLLNKFSFKNTSFKNADFRSAEMNNTKFNKVIFDKAKLIMVQSNKALYEGCSFEGTILMHSNFNNSIFLNSNLSDIVVKNSDFTNCEFRGIHILCQGLDTCKLDNLKYDKYTKWQDGFEPQRYGAIEVI